MKKTAARYNSKQTIVLGRSRFARISAVEGIALTPEMERDFKTFDAENLSDAERRQRLIKKYGNPSSKQ